MDFKAAPLTKDSVLSPEELKERLFPLVGRSFVLTGKPRTDGANIRKLISTAIQDDKKQVCKRGDYEIVPKKGKGIPRLLAELIDTYIITSGDSYNLQVWNRIPNSIAPLVRYANDDTISPKDIRFVFVKIDLTKNVIGSIIILTPQYIENEFGVFGKPTIKNQLLISENERNRIIRNGGIDFRPDTDNISTFVQKTFVKPTALAQDFNSTSIFSLDTIKSVVAEKLLGTEIPGADTKTRGQFLERMVLDLMGYGKDSKLVGGYPDVPNQLLEVKIQDTQTIDLGKYSPQYEETFCSLPFSTLDTRYLIALTNPTTHIIEGIVLSSGKHLGDHFTYVSDESYKCQRSIKMSFFGKYDGQCVFNP